MNMPKSRDIQAKMPSPKVIYASNESKSVLARNLEECRDNDKNSQSVFLSFKCIFARNCEGTEQLPFSIIIELTHNVKSIGAKFPHNPHAPLRFTPFPVTRFAGKTLKEIFRFFTGRSLLSVNLLSSVLSGIFASFPVYSQTWICTFS